MSALGNKKVFSENLKFYIDKSKKSRNDICTALNIRYSTFSEWVNGKKYPRIDKIELLANYFQIKKSDLIEKQPCIMPEPEKEPSSIDIMIATESKDLSDKDKQEILHLIQYKKHQADAENAPAPFNSSQVRTTESFVDDTERIAAFGGIKDNEDNEPRMT